MRLAVLAAALSLSLAAQAKEGMWVPQQLPEIAGPLAQAGLELDPKQLADLTGNPMGAVVALGGCTASFVSPDGLVVTNHHCAYGAIQLNSTAERNLMTDGFNAATRADEVSAGPTARVFVMDQITDVTDQIGAAAGTLSGLPRQQAIEKAQKALIAECEAEAGFRCTLYSFFGGQTYRLFRQIEIKDVRLVYAPPGSIGNYGGEVDNWMWPRHTGDFSFYRAYVGKDGKPAAFSPDNVPFKPKHHLRLATESLDAGDFVMVAGYPGTTNRYALYDEFQNVASWQYPVVGQHLKNIVALVEAAGAKDADLAVKYAATVRSWQNAMKNWDGQLEGFRRIDAAGRKQAEEQAVLAWLKSQGRDGRAALAAHERLVALAADARATRERDLVISQIAGTGLLGNLRQLHRLAIESAKPDAERAPGYQQRDLPAFEGGVRQLEKRYTPAMEKQLLAYWLGEYVKLPATQRIAALDTWLGGNDAAAITRALDATYAGTTLAGTDARLALMKADRAAIEAHADPLLKLAVALTPTLIQLEDVAKARAGDNSLHRPVYLAAVQQYKRSQGQGVYPDANLSLRITYGNVMGYTPKDGVAYTPFTSLDGVAAKATGTEPFDAPKAQLDAIRAMSPEQKAAVPVNFLSDLDITGGNSGSPVLNGKGELVGLAFDGNWESVSSNWVFDPVMTRMIAVDHRYMVWVMDKVYPAPHLLKEMGAAK
ncbi:S46 family peptidase [Arenimonas terrae]|uniref:Dipeptidyl-peptidase n=1 Tax=Arenimonas terrae TaxID=2546226 RepID=A0A5C4RQG3_9GAMM|nr:S46 family peptidase [Arenimonas terrae]TNJ33436.1 S46 family peptidase [Arenimonas terrae]